LGAKPLPIDASPRNWKVSFEAGTIKAVGTNGGRVVATHELRTAGKPAKIVLAVDRNKIAAVWDDVAYLSVTVVDANGVMVPSANDLMKFRVTGAGVIAAVESGDNSSHEPFQASERRTYQGRCFAILKANAPSGRITLTASAAGLTGGSVTINAVP
jgi:beta-galactosidase